MILNFIDLTIDNVKTVDTNELIETLFYSIEKMMKIQFIEVSKHELASKVFIPKYDYIKKEIKYEYEMLNRETVFRMRVPVIDETKRLRYKTPVFATSKPDKIPVRGYFILIEAELKVMPLGLIEVYFRGFKRPRMVKDYKNLELIKEYNRTEYLYFDYQENEFKQLITEEFEDVKRGLKNGKKLDQLLGNEAKDIHIRTYLERKAIKDIALARLNEYGEKLQDVFLEFKDDKYDVKWNDGQIVRSKGVIVTTDVTSNTIFRYLGQYGKTLTETIPDWLKINLLFSNITVMEFNRLLKNKNELAEKLIDIEEDLFQLEGLLNKNNLLRKRQQKKILTIQNIDWKTKKDLYTDEEELVHSIQWKLDNWLEKPKEIRPKEFNKQIPLEGYIFDEETNELYPTFAEMENRRYLKEEYSSQFKDREYIEKVLNSQQQN